MRGTAHRPARPLRALGRDRRGVALTEFVFVLPVLLVLALYGIEITNYAIVRQKVSQLALQVADNASRMGDQDYFANRPISEGEVNDLLIGAELQAGSLDIARQGRIIISSLEFRPSSTTTEYIHWQRCHGALGHESSWGREGDTVDGMGPPEERVHALPDIPVMFVEIGYEYQPLISSSWAPGDRIVEFATLAVRDDRSPDYIRPTAGQTPATC